MHTQDSGREQSRGNGPAARRPVPPQRPGWAGGVLALQRRAGNAAVSRALAEGGHREGSGGGRTDASVQRAEGFEDNAAHRHGPDCAHEATPVQRRVSPADAIATPGRPLPARIVARMEQEYPMSFGHVRLHDGPVAQRSAADHGAVAYTTGSHIVSARSQLDDETLYHEGGHIWQQAMGEVAGTDDGSGTRVSSPHDAFELQAAENGRRMARGERPDLELPGL
ncbi:DUF4157 domain-containing protein [Streptomyces griseoaurantiacus]|uniref:eCIS core domain-containing protein n=1 Tax=Streptomyces griseoaurantiacus TaxID=68213 RepID=UPI003460B4E3